MCSVEAKEHKEQPEHHVGPLVKAERGPAAEEFGCELPLSPSDQDPNRTLGLRSARAVRPGPRGLLVADAGRSRILEVHDGKARALVTGEGRDDGDDLLRPMDMVACGDVLLVVDTGRSRLVACSGLSKGTLSPPKTVLQPGGARGKSSPEGLKFPRGICLTKKAIYLVDSWSHRLRRLALPDSFDDLDAVAEHFASSLHTVMGGGMPGDGLNQLRFPTDVLVESEDPECETVLLSDTGNHRVLRVTFREKAEVKVVCGGEGVGPAHLNSPAGLARAADGTLFVADTDNSRVQRFAPGAKEGTTVCSSDAPWGLRLDGSLLYISDGQCPTLLKVEV
jgi:sugar lactone lactonase YvrE